MMKIKATILLTLLLSAGLFAQDTYIRSAVIPVPAIENGGYGNVVSGVDFDGDGMQEIYAINQNWNDSGNELIPRIYKYENNAGSWDSVWSATLNIPLQNTWPAIAAADLDNDGKMEIVWGPVNFTSAENPNPSRFVVFEAVGDGSDNLGVDDGAGGWLPNAEWNGGIVDDGTNMRPIRFIINDVDNDGTQEILFPDRGGYYYLGVVSVDNVPDAGDGSETWTMEFSGKEVMAESFVRSGVIGSPDGGFGNVASGMDYDADGLMDLYAVNDNWNDGPNGELIPTLYKYELVSGAWVLRWSTVIPGIDFQNTWPVMVTGDWDGDGKGEVIWCPVNNFGTGNEDPDRIVVYETPGDGSDEMGIDQGDGSWAPNAGWNMDVPASTSMRPFRGTVADVDGDGAAEFIFAERHNYYVWGVIGVSDIPDAGDGSETWTMKANGVPDAGNDYRDVAVMDQTIYLFDSDGGIREITNDGAGAYTTADRYQAYPGWSWLSANTVDIDDDGTEEIVTGDYLSGGTASVFVLVEDGDSLLGYPIADFSANAATRITSVRAGLVDADTLVDFVVGFRDTDEIYLVSYQGGDITSAANYTVRLLDKGVNGAEGIGQMDMMTLADVDADGKDEVFYTGVPRGIAENTQPLTIGDFGDWTLEGGSTRWDMAYANNMVYVTSLGGASASAYFESDTTGWKYGSVQDGIVPGGSFKSLASYDVDGDGVEEILAGNYGSAMVYLLKMENGGLVTYEIADLSALGITRITGGAAGDIDGDGNVDYVVGSRDSENILARVKYTGGDITDPMSWSSEFVDGQVMPTSGQVDVVQLANLDDDPALEIIYTGTIRNGTMLPIVVVDVQTVEAETIAAVRIDADSNFVPDRLGEIVTVKGVITSPTINSLFSLSINIQDETAGINIYSSVDSIFTTVGDLVQITGEIDQYNGLTEIVVADKADIVRLGVGTVPQPIVISPSVNMTPYDMEKLESMLVQVNGVTKVNGDWPDVGSDSNLDMWDGAKSPEGDSLIWTMRIDKELDLAGQPEPVYPINVVGFLGQFDSSTPPDDGYQVFPRYYTDIEQDVAAPPNANFWFTEETKALDGGRLEIGDASADYPFVWHPAVDLNGEDLIYQVVIWNVDNGNTALLTLSDNNGVDTSLTPNGQTLIDLISAAGDTSLSVGMVLRTVSTKPAEGIIASVDTLRFTMADFVTDVDEQSLIPKEFFVDQNYPNPFNPSTTIQFGLPQDAKVNLVVYDILGRVVTRLIDNQVMGAGVYQRSFDASKLASGTYIYRLQADQKVEVKKMLLLK